MKEPLIIGVDFETHIFTPGNMAPKPICMSTSFQRLRSGPCEDVMVSEMMPRLFRKYIEAASYGSNSGCRLALHHAPFDLSCFINWIPDSAAEIFHALESGGIHCTRVRERLLDIAQGTGRDSYSLENLSRDVFKIELEKSNSWRLRFPELESLPISSWPFDAISYVKTDARLARELFDRQSAMARSMNYENFESESARQTAFAFALKLTSDRGMILDSKRVLSQLAKIQTEVSSFETELERHQIFHAGTRKKNLEVIQTLVEKSFPGDPPRTEKTKKIKTDADVVSMCDDPVLKIFAKYQNASKLLHTYFEPLAELDSGPVHTEFESLVNSGRTTCHSPNLQFLPRHGGVRECFIPREGFVFVLCDFDSQELRTLAQACKILCGKSTLADRYAADPNFDPHSDFAARLLGITYKDGIERKNGNDPEFIERRQSCKAANFGFPVGMAAQTFVRKCRIDGIEISLSEAEHLKIEWQKQWPEMKIYFRIVQDMIRTSGGVVAQLVSGRLRGGCDFTAAANTIFQGLAADASKNALYETVKNCTLQKGVFAGSHPLLFLHDEIILETPIGPSMNDVALELALTMEGAMSEICPDVPSRCSPMIATRWSKKARPVFDNEGRLKPWHESN